jgi:hypothetical protein
VLSDDNALWDEEDCDDDNNNHNKPDSHSRWRKVSPYTCMLKMSMSLNNDFVQTKNKTGAYVKNRGCGTNIELKSHITSHIGVFPKKQHTVSAEH